MVEAVSGFMWDDGNWPKCGKHGVSKVEIEDALINDPLVQPDPTKSYETRFNAVGLNASRRHVFVVFTFRRSAAGTMIRPISARYMHDKEVRAFDKATGS